MGKRLIPRKDHEFANKFLGFARRVGTDPQRFAHSADEAATLNEAAQRFQKAVQTAQHPGSQSRMATVAKDEARAEAERLYQRAVKRIRAIDGLDAQLRLAAGMDEPVAKKRARTVPQEPPAMRFVRAQFDGALPMHELSFGPRGNPRGPKPSGAARIELFVDLIGPDEPVPGSPGANDGGRPWYLRSFSRSPIRIVPPICRVPMLVVYWGRWADAVGNVGPWSATVVSRVEGHSPHVRLSSGTRNPNHRVPVLEDPSQARRAPRYSVVVLEAQQRALLPEQVSAPEREQRQLEGPETVEEAA
jgi:hypothetical protein